MRRLLFVALFTTRLTAAPPDIHLDAPRLFASPGTPANVAAGDFNGDGFRDVVVPNGGGVTIAFGSATGAGAPRLFDFAASGARAVAVADFDGDGLEDIAVNDFASHGLVVVRGNGDGTFGTLRTFGGNVYGSRLLTGDFDGNGSADVLVLPESGTLGDLWMAAPGRTLLLSRVNASAQTVAADFDVDGRTDLASANGRVEVALASGYGAFTSALTTENLHANGIAAADFDGDGVDLFVAGTEQTSSLLRGRGDGTFDAARAIVGPENSGVFSVLASGDVDRNGLADVVIRWIEDGTWWTGTLMNPANGMFIVRGVHARTELGALLEDVNGDGRVDLITTREDAADFTIAAGCGDGTFDTGTLERIAARTIPPTIPGFTPPVPTLSAVAADIDRDGRAELLVADSFAGAVSIVRRGAFTTVAVPQPAQLFGPFDLDNDGDPDFLVRSGEDILALRNNNGTLASERTPVTATVAATTGDFNHDGFVDVAFLRATVKANEYTVRITYGAGKFHFPTSTTVATITAFATALPMTLTAGDFTGDGRDDLLVATDKLVLYIPDAKTFSAKPLDATARRVFAAGDFDGDGKLDFVSIHPWPTLFRGRGDGTFEDTAITRASNALALRALAADMNRDGLLDLLILDEDTLAAYAGNGDGTFQPPVSYAMPLQTPGELALGDWNGDGRLDVAAPLRDVAYVQFIANDARVKRRAAR